MKFLTSKFTYEAYDDYVSTNNVKFYFDYQNGEYGFNTSETRGADTFSPFKKENANLFIPISFYNSGGAENARSINSDYSCNLTITGHSYEGLYEGISFPFWVKHENVPISIHFEFQAVYGPINSGYTFGWRITTAKRSGDYRGGVDNGLARNYTLQIINTAFTPTSATFYFLEFYYPSFNDGSNYQFTLNNVMIKEAS